MRYHIRPICDYRERGEWDLGETITRATTSLVAADLASAEAVGREYGVAVVDIVDGIIDWGGDRWTTLDGSAWPSNDWSDEAVLVEIGRTVERLLSESAGRPDDRAMAILRVAERRGIAVRILVHGQTGRRSVWQVRHAGVLHEDPVEWRTVEDVARRLRAVEEEEEEE
jgi:hypothetical protein